MDGGTLLALGSLDLEEMVEPAMGKCPSL